MLIGTLDTDNNTTNTKKFINGNTCTFAGAAGSIQYFATGSGGHIFYNNGEKFRISNTGELINQHWKLTTGSDGYCRLYNNAGNDYYNFWAKALNANTSLSVGTTATINGDIDCGGGISINGSTAFYFASDVVDAINRTNTYIIFNDAGATSDWCYHLIFTMMDLMRDFVSEILHLLLIQMVL